MNRTQLVGGLLVAVTIGLVAIGAILAGVGPAPGGDASGDRGGGPGDDTETFPTATTTVTANGASDGATAERPFTFAIDTVEECGQTCRDVTATVTNEQNQTATGVTVFTRIYAGENTTASDDQVWEGSVDIGRLEAGASQTSTRRVELSLLEARQIDQADGWITIQTTVQSDETMVTFVNSEQVS
jgi:hypothetical protein